MTISRRVSSFKVGNFYPPNKVKVQTSQASSHDLYWKKNRQAKKSVKFLFKHRQSMGKVELYFSDAAFLGEVYRGIAA